MTNKYSQTTMNKAIGYFIGGLGRAAIGEKIGVPEGTVRRWIEKYKIGELEHTHHWVVESPNGPLSKGKCACGQTREFPNSSDALDRWRKSDGKRPTTNRSKDALETKRKKKSNFNGKL